MTTKAAKAGPKTLCLVKGCNNPAVGNERLCAIHFYELPRNTRQALAVEDGAKQSRDQRLISYVLGGQPLDQIYIT